MVCVRSLAASVQIIMGLHAKQVNCFITKYAFKFFTINTKLSMLASKVLTEAKVTSGGVRLDDHWFKGLMLNQLSWPGMC